MFPHPAIKMIVGLGLISIAGAMLYVHYRKKDDEDELDSIGQENTVAKTKKEVMLKLTISNEILPVIVGRSGANIKIIEEKTGTAIKFREKNDDDHYCEIRGDLESVQRAKEMISKELQRPGHVTVEMLVPQGSCGKIIGRCGESLHEICRKSLAKVSIDAGGRSANSNTRRVLIQGNRNQVEIAKKLIENKIQEDVEQRKCLDEIEQKREPRRSPTNSVSSTHSSLTSISGLLPPGEKLSLSDNEKPMEVYVSAIASPAKFWLQLVGPQSHKLDQLVADMTDYYSQEGNQNLHKISDPYLGQIVAALFKYDGKWYRAEIIGILPNEYNPRDVVLDLYFVDYGDSVYIEPHEVFELRTDFLTLRFQAIECFLAHVKPALSADPEMWDPQTIAKFEEMTHVASWKKLISRVVTYKERSKGDNNSKREGSPVPGVELFDTADGNDTSVAHTLISQGYALADFPRTPSPVPPQNQNDVLRLDGGDAASKINSPPAQPTRTTPIFDTSSNTERNAFNNHYPASNGNLKISNNAKHYTKQLNESQNNQHGNGNIYSGFETTTPNSKEFSKQLLHTEKSNGNLEEQHQNVVDKNWNSLVDNI